MAQQPRDHRRHAELARQRVGAARRRTARGCQISGAGCASEVGLSASTMPDLAHRAELLVALLETRPRRRSRRRSASAARQRGVEQRRGAPSGSVCAPPIGSVTISSMMPSAQQVGRRDLQRLGRLDLAAGVAPQDRGAAFGRNHAVDGELVHQDAVADGDAERAAAAALAVHDDDDRHVEHRHLAQVERDRLGDAALLGLDAGIGRRRVDEADDRRG